VTLGNKLFYTPELIEELAESWCPNDIAIEDCSGHSKGDCDCYYDGEDNAECIRCWEMSLDKLERKVEVE
jgi:hypothetical protein